jgi:hypothetical protein
MDPDCLDAGGVVIVALIMGHLLPALYDTDPDHPDASLKADREGQAESAHMTHHTSKVT